MASESKKHPFDYHAPNPQQVADIKINRDVCKQEYDWINHLVAQGRMEPRCAAIAKTKLEEVSMWVNKAIIMSDPQPIPDSATTVAQAQQTTKE